MTTGLFPQEVIIDLGSAINIKEVRFNSTGVKKVQVEGCKSTNASEFKNIGETKELGSKGVMQRETVRLTDPAPYHLIKFIVKEGHEDFASLHFIEFA